jgi:hypothetical protein
MVADMTFRSNGAQPLPHCSSASHCVTFGSYPAAKASKMTPIDALQRN